MNKIEYNGYKRINKAQARKEYNNGNSVYILPCKVRLDTGWILPYIINSNINEAESFDKIVNEYECYNCICNELGKYASYYIKEANKDEKN